MSVGELLDATFSLYRRNFLTIAAISAVVQVPYAVLTFVILEVSGFAQVIRSPFAGLTTNQSQALTPEQAQTLLDTVGGVLAVTVALALVQALILQPLATAATTRAVSDRYLDCETSVGASYRAALRRLRPLVWQSVILALFFSAALVALVFVVVALVATGGGAFAALLALVLAVGFAAVLVGVYVFVSFSPPAIVLEGLSGWGGLKRSWRLVQSRFWRILGIRLLVGLIAYIVGGIVAVIFNIPGAALDANGAFAVSQAGTAVTAVFIGPITYVAVTLLYYDTRIRTEGFDIEMLAQSL